MDPYLISFPITIALSFALGLFTLIKNPRNRVNQTWAAACFCCFIWSSSFLLIVFSKSRSEADVFVLSANIVASWMCVLVAHFCFALTNSEKPLSMLIKAGYFVSFFITLTPFVGTFAYARPILNFKYYTAPGIFYHFFTAQFVAFVLYAEYLLIKGLHDSSPEKRNQIKYVLVGLTCGYIGGSATFLPVYSIPVEPFLAHFVWLYAAIVSYAIIKHQLMDIKVVIKKTLFYSTWVFLISLSYVAAIYLTHQLVVGNYSIGSLTTRFDFRYPHGLYALFPFIGTVVFFVLGIFFLLNRPRTKEKTLFSILCFETFHWQIVWFISFFVRDDSYLNYLARLAYITIIPLPFTFYHFIASYLKRRSEMKYVSAFYVLALILMALLPTDLFVAGNRRFDWGNFTRPGPLFPLFTLGALASMVRGLVILRQGLRETSGRIDLQNQYKYLFLGFSLYFFCTLDFMQVYGLQWYPIGTFFFIASFVIIAYAITKHGLLDVRVVIKKTLIYTLITAAISILYLSVVLIFHALFFSGSAKSPSFLLSFGAVLFIAITFKPLEMAMYRLMERRFFRGTISEISEQKEKLEDRLERTERLKSVGILAAGMAHEIKNPLTVMSTFVEYLPKKYEDAEFRRKFESVMKTEVERMKKLVSDLLLYSKPSEPVRAVCRPADTVTEILELLSGEFLKHHVRVNQKLDPVLSFFDPSQIKQALLNVFLNALDAMKERGGGELIVSVSDAVGGVEITVRDTGCGIASEKLAHLFDPFYTDKDDGTGLGLAITHSMIVKNGGTVSVQSELGVGTAFTITLPKP